MLTKEPLVVGVDGTHPSLRALQWALAEARRRQCRLDIVMAWESHAVLSGPAPLLMQPALAPHHVRQQRRMELVRAVRSCTAGMILPEVNVELIEGPATAVLLRKSQGAAMLVLGASRHGRTTAIVGSTALKCLRNATCPVLVVPDQWESQPASGVTGDTPSRDPALG